MKIIICGLGGVGSHLLLPLLQYLNFEKNIFDEIWLVDGDTFEQKNITRQNVTSFENKAISQVKYYREIFEKITLMFIDKYITESNIDKIINNGDVVLLCVDNNKTRKLLEDYFDKVDNLTVISGGNELYDGNIMITQKIDGKFNSKKFSELHPELKNPTDKNPDEMSCEELSESSPQISIVNATIADLMRRTLYAMISGKGIKYEEIFVNCLTGMERVVLNESIKDKLVIKNISNN